MPKKRIITFDVSAFDDQEDIRTWYKDQQQVPGEGILLVKEIISQIERLADFPESGRIVPEFDIENLREIIYGPFRIDYRIERNTNKNALKYLGSY